MKLIKLLIYIQAVFYCLKGKDTEIHFMDCKSNEITEEYIYTNIYKIFLAYYSTIIKEILYELDTKLYDIRNK